MNRPTGTLLRTSDHLGPGAAWVGLGGDAFAFALSRLPPGRWLVVTDSRERLEHLQAGLEFFPPRSPLAVFPPDDGRPYDGFAPDPALGQERARTLRRLEGGGPMLVLTTATALLTRVPSKEARAEGTFSLAAGQRLDRETLVGWLSAGGYLATGRLDGPGTFAARGDVLDVWPAGARRPARVDFFDDEIESVRRLEPETLRPVAGSDKPLTLYAAREVRLDPPSLQRFALETGRWVAAQNRGHLLRRRLLEELRGGLRFPAIDDYLPAFVPVVSPLEALGELRVIAHLPDDVLLAARDFEASARQRWQLLPEDERPLVPPEERYAPAREVASLLARALQVVELAAENALAVDFGARPPEALLPRGQDLGPVVATLSSWAEEGAGVVLVADTPRRAEHLLELLGPRGLHPSVVPSGEPGPRGKVVVQLGALPRGFVALDAGLAFVPAALLLGASARTRVPTRTPRLGLPLDATLQLKADDYVVHRRHGVGVFRGLARLEVGGSEQDFAKLEYRGGDLLYLPVTGLGQLSRFVPSGEDATVRLDKLGGVTWSSRKGKVRDNLLKMADELARTAALRIEAARPPHDPPGPLVHAFEARFPYVETDDQLAAIEAIHEDLSGDQPMDRLLCGDVGFGKTEVAMRAAARVVEGGRQVAVLCPTTVLAHQHLRTFTQRFAGLPVRVAMLSRFTPDAEVPRIKADLAEGAVDIVIGTTTLLSRSVRFRQLGLLVVDEEHRFGVRQKERLKRLRSEVDVLSMSATPIPRSLQQALSGLRSMSLIATPPRSRLPVRTAVAPYALDRLLDALRSELARGGQAYVVHNRVETLPAFAAEIAEHLPEARVVWAHGQLDEEALEAAFVAFVERRADVLVATSIVESGIDLPNVNTLVVDRADRFGLAQLHQLRGRVGRGDARATCLLLVPQDVQREAQRRLRVLVENSHLGAGFQIAMADLELRGGGNLLGSAQSGNIDLVGYDTWVELVQEVVEQVRGQVQAGDPEPLLEVPVQAFLPEDLVRDPADRLAWYRRLGGARRSAQVEAAASELEAEIGRFPPEVRNLVDLAHLAVGCRELGISRCAFLKIRAVLELMEGGKAARNAERLVSQAPKRYALRRAAGLPLTLEVRFTERDGTEPLRALRWLLSQVASPP